MAEHSALFVCEDMPIAGTSGPATYNRAIFDALISLGYSVELLVTTPRLQVLAGRNLAVPGAAGIQFLHARITSAGLKPASLAARLRALKHRWFGSRKPRLMGSTAQTPDRPHVAHVGRQLTAREAARIGKMTQGRSFDVVVIDTVFRAAALNNIPACERKLLVAHDVFFKRVASFRSNGFAVATTIDASAEIALWRRFDAIAAISEVEADAIRQVVDIPTRAIFPVVASSGPLVTRDGGHIMYLGTAAYHNVDGMRWFLESVWPLVLREHPKAELEIVGSIAASFTETLPQGVRLLGRVDDLESVADRCSFAVNPVRMGSGIKIKMVDYFRLGLPCIVTSIGADGFPGGVEQPFVTVGDEQAFATAICTWLAQPDAAKTTAAAIPAYLAQFSPEAASRALGALLNDGGL